LEIIGVEEEKQKTLAAHVVKAPKASTDKVVANWVHPPSRRLNRLSQSL
jgi:hypothetical protein